MEPTITIQDIIKAKASYFGRNREYPTVLRINPLLFNEIKKDFSMKNVLESVNVTFVCGIKVQLEEAVKTFELE